MLRKGFLSLVMIGALAACGSDEESNIGKPGAGGSLEDLAAPTKWKGQCVDRSDGDSVNPSFSVQKQTMTITSIIHEDDCESGASHEYRAVYRLVTQGTNSINTDATNLNMTAIRIEMKPSSQATADKFNSDNECGRAGWEEGKWRNVTTTDCFPKNPNYYTVFAIEETTNRLFLGIENDAEGKDGSTPAKRLVDFDTIDFFTAVP